ncbi:MAG: hypothetical protein JO300_12180, partial [Silvibacterium sp.]|nr:hypothetical protein [Silvibacterium sp.]
MLLSVFTRHSSGCRFSRDRASRRCNCPKWVGGQINGYYFRQSARTRLWAEAEAFRQTLEDALMKGLPPIGPGTIAVPPVTDNPKPVSSPQASAAEISKEPAHEIRIKPKPRVTVAQAVEAYLADAVSRSVEPSTLKKLETI